jgi:hypothetical protein
MVTPSNLRRLERLEEKSAVPDMEYENFMDNLLEARRQVAVLIIKLMDDGLEGAERAEVETRYKQAKDFVKELEAHRPLPGQLGLASLSCQPIWKRCSKSAGGSAKRRRRENGSEVGGRSRDALRHCANSLLAAERASDGPRAYAKASWSAR